MLADSHRSIVGVVGWLDLCDPTIEQRIAYYANQSRFVGVRMMVHNYSDPDFAASDAHIGGVGLLAEYGLSYDLLIRTPQIAAATLLADRLPNARLVIDHIAKPNISKGWGDIWAGRMAEIAKRPNVTCKLSLGLHDLFCFAGGDQYVDILRHADHDRLAADRSLHQRHQNRQRRTIEALVGSFEARHTLGRDLGIQRAAQLIGRHPAGLELRRRLFRGNAEQLIPTDAP